ncbi:DUF3192 domain-containing protein [Veronia nyctiphanis]|uniref:DUF3192 domain-containing protein n=1 Tax=Veronia nyctiphanis TaxID=1278244 RepID=UPI0038B57520
MVFRCEEETGRRVILGGIQQDNKSYKVLFYRTHYVKGDGHDTKDECTPVIFADEKLLGWGDEILSQVTEHKQS